MGRHREALENLELAEQYRDPAKEKPLSHRFGVDPGLDLLAWKVLTLTHLGQLDQAAGVREQLRMELLEHRHPQTFAACNLHSVVWPAVMLRDFEAGERYGAELVAFCKKRRSNLIASSRPFFMRVRRARRNPTAENIAAIRAALDAHHRSGGSVYESLFLAQLAEALLSAGDLTSAEGGTSGSITPMSSDRADGTGSPNYIGLDGLIALKRARPRWRARECMLPQID